eukprot:gene338-189_t
MPSRVPYHLVATDMDGTLLNDSHHVTPFTQLVLKQLVSAYPHTVSVALASGRIHTDLAHLLNSLDLPEGSGFIISSNGARVHRRVKGPGGEMKLEEIYAKNLSSDDVCYLLSLLPDTEAEINVNLYQDDRWRCVIDWEDQLEYFKESGVRYELFKPSQLIEAYLAWKRNGAGMDPLAGVAKLYFGTDNTARLEKLLQRVKTDRPSLVITSSSKYTMEINAPGVTKASGIDELLHHLYHEAIAAGVPAGTEAWSRQQCIAFGDGHNDEEMLRQVGKGCVMGNAPDSLKQLLPGLEIIGRNTEDAVAHKLKAVFHLP